LAGTRVLFTPTRRQSIAPRVATWSGSTWWRRSQTPARCQPPTRREWVIPLPQSNSGGNSAPGMPLL